MQQFNIMSRLFFSISSLSLRNHLGRQLSLSQLSHLIEASLKHPGIFRRASIVLLCFTTCPISIVICHLFRDVLYALYHENTIFSSKWSYSYVNSFELKILNCSFCRLFIHLMLNQKVS
eukprot:TRINITY_DN83868_c0_g1_i1.p1 TRINITY_DN83868_c0_g1~~TRINITY_DN83868_c0_g1_i1.p1  ORF type:complete len:119 (+),score=1.74 TRINITY_DN83868_c0_g1_i1:127-483(+)